MKLSDLFLNRFLYRDNNQSSETQDAAFISADSSDAEPTPLASGGAAQDINTSNVYINGEQIQPGTIPSTVLDVSNWGWGQTCAFTSTDADTVSWGAGTFKSADGTTYSISAGNTGNMTAKTYIYLSLLDSETVYQTTTTSSNAVGLGKVLVAVAENAAVSATFMLSEATQIVGDNIIANTIDASKITAGQLVVGTNVGIGTAFPSASAGDLAYQDMVSSAMLDSTVIVGGYIKTSLLTADNITTGTLTGRTVQTASTGQRIILSQADNDIKIYNSGGNLVGKIFGSTTGTADIYVQSESGNNLLLNCNSSSYALIFQNAGNVIAYVATGGLTIYSGKTLNVVDGKMRLPVGTDVY